MRKVARASLATLHIRERLALVFLLALLALATAGLFSQPSHRFVSSEVKFSDSSPSGLSIVPASCPSFPHYAGECGAGGGDNALCVSNTIPTTMYAGQTVAASVTFQNNGGTTWTLAAPNYYIYLLSWQSAIHFNPTSYAPAGSLTVAPGASYKFDFNLTAPSVAGTYPAQYQMIRAGVAVFGGACGQTSVAVSSCVPTYSCVGNSVHNSCSGTDTPCGARTCVESGGSASCQCPVGYTWDGSSCIIDTNPTCTCSPGTFNSGTWTCDLTAVDEFLTSGSSWSVPPDWNDANNSIEVIGGGGGGGGGQGNAGGGGGGYAKVTDQDLPEGNSVTYAIGGGGAVELSGGNTYLCNSTLSCANINDTNVIVGATGGGGAANNVPGNGGAAVKGSGSSGGSGGVGTACGFMCGGGAGGGGGAAGPNGSGVGGNGGAGVDDGFNRMGSGGGGGNGGGTSATIASGSNGSAGGNNASGSGGGTAGHDSTTNGGNGSSGGGGGGGRTGGNGGAGIEWGSYGSGGGGGGGEYDGGASDAGGDGGLYGGGGGGGSSNPGVGAAGIIHIKSTPSGAPLPSCNCSAPGYTYDDDTHSCITDTACVVSDSWCQDLTHIANNCGTVTSCTSGTQCVTSAGVASCQCIPTFSCSGNGVYNSCTDIVTDCQSGYSCDAAIGSCVPDFEFTVTPLLVRKGSTVSVSWSALGVDSCTVSGTNNDGGPSSSWTCADSACNSTITRTSSAIFAQTTFTLSCERTAGGTIQQTKTVNILPVFCETGTPGCP